MAENGDLFVEASLAQRQDWYTHQEPTYRELALPEELLQVHKMGSHFFLAGKNPWASSSSHNRLGARIN